VRVSTHDRVELEDLFRSFN